MATKGVTTKGKGNGTATTTGVTTQASGSLFVVGVAVKQAAVTPVPVVTDNKGNTYSQVGTPRTDTGSITTFFFVNTTGSTGGATHTHTATLTGKDMAVFMAEGIGCASGGTPDASNGAGNNFTASLSTGSISLTPVAGGEFVVSIFSSASFPTVAPSVTGFTTTVDQSFTDNSSGGTGAMAAAIVTSTASYSATWTDASGASGETAQIIAFQGASGGTTMAAATGTFTVSGQAVTLSQGSGPTNITMLASAGTFDVIGAPSSSDFAIEANYGSFGVLPQVVTFANTSGGGGGSGVLPTIYLPDATPVPSTAVYIAGTAFAPTGEMYIAPFPSDNKVYARGPFIDRKDGARVVATVGTTHVRVQGIAFTAQQEMLVTTNAPDVILSGIPLSTAGYVSVTSAS